MIFGNFVLTLGIIVLESELGEGLLPSHSVGDFVALVSHKSPALAAPSALGNGGFFIA
jgi:hypothetical protein